MNMRQLRYFLAVAQELNFTRAAERLGIAQPPLSQQIIALEQEMGVPLFERENRRLIGVSLAGEVLMDHAHRVLNAAAAAVDAVKMTQHGVRASLAVGAIYSSLYAFLPDVLRDFAVRKPDVQLSLQEMTIAQQIPALREGAIEVGLLRGPVHHRELRSEILYRERLVLAVPSNSRWASDLPISIGEVADLPMIMVQRQSTRSYSDQVYDLFERRELSPVVSHHTLDMHTAICLVAAGLGVSIVPAVVQLLQTNGIAYRPFADVEAGVTFALAMRHTSQSAHLESFIEAARAKAGEMLAAHPQLFVASAG